MRAIGLVACVLTWLSVALPDARAQSVGVRPRGPLWDSTLWDSARNNDFDGLVKAIRENGEEHNYYIHPRSGGGSPNSRLHLMLRDCRIAKLRSCIQEKPASERGAIAGQLFDSALKAYDANVERIFAAIRGEKGKFDPFQGRYDAALAMLLLCSEFCEPKMFVSQVDNLKAVIQRHNDTKARIPELQKLYILGVELEPDAAYLRNLYLYFLQIRFPESGSDADVRTALFWNGPDRRQEAPILYWDLKSNSVATAPMLHDTCQLFPEFYGMGHEKTDAQQEKRLRVVVDKYVAKANDAVK